MESGLTLWGSLRMTTNIRGLVFPKKDGLKPCGQAFTNYQAALLLPRKKTFQVVFVLVRKETSNANWRACHE